MKRVFLEILRGDKEVSRELHLFGCGKFLA